MAKLQKLGALLATAPFIASSNAVLADQFFETVKAENGDSYCVGSTTVEYFFKGIAQNNNNKTDWSLDDVDWFEGYQLSDDQTDGNILAKQLSNDSIGGHAQNKFLSP